MDSKEIAKNYLKGFTKALVSLLQESTYDLVVAPANSGSAMIVFAEIIAQAARIDLPRTLILPIFSNRPGSPKFDNHSLVQKIIHNSQLETSYRKILFVDDEMGDGYNLATCIGLLQSANKIALGATCTILSEGGSGWEYPLPNITTDFLPYAIRPANQWKNIMFNLLPDYMLQDFQNKVDFRLSPKEATCLVFSLPLKDLVGSEPYLNYEMLNRAEKRMPTLGVYQKQWLEIVAGIISESLLELENKEKAKVQLEKTIFGKLLFDF
ncbi:MAG: hypothetical protein KW793_03115 [Candidatus Doudnabacteria bacterium]|nr:hypothetical protein [Candidatus Doudnabacteria bacterium]